MASHTSLNTGLLDVTLLPARPYPNTHGRVEERGRPFHVRRPREWRSESSSPQRLFVLPRNLAPVCRITLQLTSGEPDTSGEGVGCLCHTHTHTRAFTRLALPLSSSLFSLFLMTIQKDINPTQDMLLFRVAATTAFDFDWAHSRWRAGSV